MKLQLYLGRLMCVAAASLLLGACASSPPASSLHQTERQLSAQYPQLRLAENSLGKSLLSINEHEQLSLEKVLQLMLSNSPQVRMELARLGVADAKSLQAELIENPHISIGLLKPEDGGRWQLDAALSQPLLDLFTRPLRRKLAQVNLLEAQLVLQAELQQLIGETTALYFDAVAELQHCYVQNKLVEAATAKQQLALSLYKAGNMPENDFLAYDNDLRRAQQKLEQHQGKAYEKQLKLLNAIGLEASASLNLPSQLPQLPQLPNEYFDRQALVKVAQTTRIDLKIAQQQLTTIEQRRSLVKQEHGWRDMSMGIAAEREFDGAKNYGPEIEFALPIFNRGQGKQALLQAQRDKLSARFQQLTLNAESEIAQALNRMDSASVQLQLISAALMVAEKRVELSNREVNFMLGSPFELLSIKRQQIQLAHDFTALLNDYWQARAELELAIGKSLPVQHTAVTEHSTHTSAETQKHQNHQEHNHD